MLKHFVHIIVLLFIVMASGCNQDAVPRKRIDETYTLGAADKRPFGGYTFRYLADFAFVDDYITENSKPFNKWHSDFLSYNDNKSGNTYILVSPTLPTYKDEVIAMTDFVERGNTLFVAADYFDPYFLEMFDVSQSHEINVFSTALSMMVKQTSKQLADTATFHPASFSYFCYPMRFSLDADSSRKYEVLGYNDFHKPDVIRVRYGKGELILMTNATGLSNYFLLTPGNYRYALDLLSYLPVYNKQVVWDDFYRRYGSKNQRPPEGQSMFSALFSIPQMKWAFWILLSMMAIWFITNLARRQRIIPIKKPNLNSSTEFTQTIARLYFNKKDNHNIALKMIAYFQDYVRSKYYMNYTGINEEFARSLATKTGLPAAKAEALVNSIYKVQHNSTTSDEALLQLNEQIQEVLNITHAKI